MTRYHSPEDFQTERLCCEVSTAPTHTCASCTFTHVAQYIVWVIMYMCRIIIQDFEKNGQAPTVLKLCSDYFLDHSD